MRNHSRRQFIKTTLSSAGLVLTVPAWLRGSETKTTALSIKATDIVTLGRTGVRVPRLAQGTGFNGSARSSEHTRMGRKACDELLRHGLDQGLTFLDMADLYGTHPFVKEVIKDLPREKFSLLTKIWVRKENWVTPSGGAKEELDRFRKELGVEMIDICLIHCMSDGQWPDTFARVRDELSELKQKGVVRAVGVSCHDHGALKAAAAHPWVDLILARINYKGGPDYAMDGTTEQITETLKLARKNGKAVIGMKIFGAGKLVKPEEKDASLNYVLGNQLVDSITVGMLKPEQMDDTIKRISQVQKPA
jgi:1-deoxyxylulose-5-phosphate synthase